MPLPHCTVYFGLPLQRTFAATHTHTRIYSWLPHAHLPIPPHTATHTTHAFYCRTRFTLALLLLCCVTHTTHVWLLHTHLTFAPLRCLFFFLHFGFGSHVLDTFCLVTHGICLYTPAAPFWTPYGCRWTYIYYYAVIYLHPLPRAFVACPTAGYTRVTVTRCRLTPRVTRAGLPSLPAFLLRLRLRYWFYVPFPVYFTRCRVTPPHYIWIHTPLGYDTRGVTPFYLVYCHVYLPPHGLPFGLPFYRLRLYSCTHLLHLHYIYLVVADRILPRCLPHYTHLLPSTVWFGYLQFWLLFTFSSWFIGCCSHSHGLLLFGLFWVLFFNYTHVIPIGYITHVGLLCPWTFIYFDPVLL